VTEGVLPELDSLIDDVLDKLPDFEQLLASPRIGLEEKNRMLDEAFATRMSPLLLTFLKVTARHGRLDCLRQIRVAARQLFNEMRGRVEVTVETVDTLDQQTRSLIENHLTASLGRQVELCCNVNPRLLGGLVLRVGDTVYDGSLNQRLEKMRCDTLDQTAKLIRDSLQRFVTAD
jgi:F-type H+-transporting ATPase subunit delta